MLYGLEAASSRWPAIHLLIFPKRQPCYAPVVNTVILTRTLRRLLKLLHTLGAAGFMGGMAAVAAVLCLAPASGGAAGALPVIGALANIAAWLIGPSMILTVISGLLAMLANPAFYDVGWVWAKAATGILILEGGLHVMGPIQDEAKRGAAGLGLGAHPTSLADLVAAEVNTVWVLLAVSAANIALAIWRPRLLPD